MSTAEAAPEAAGPTETDNLSEELRCEGDIIPDEDLGLEDAIDEIPPSLVVAAAESLTEVP